MASLLYDSAIFDEAQGNVTFGADTFYCMLVTSSYAPNKKTHTKRSDVTNEVAASGGYVAGGFVASVSAANDTANDRTNVTLGGISVGSATITAAGAVYYKHRGGAASADEIVSYIDFGGNVTSTNGTWSLTASTYRKQN